MTSDERLVRVLLKYLHITPLQDWSAEDLGELETLVNAELQDRSYRNGGYIMAPEDHCDSGVCRFVPVIHG